MFDKYLTQQRRGVGGGGKQKRTLRGNMTEKFMTHPYLGRWRSFVSSILGIIIGIYLYYIRVTNKDLHFFFIVDFNFI